MSRNREIDLTTVLYHELAAIPSSLFSHDGTMRKTAKSNLAKKLESMSSEVYELPETDTSENALQIIDGMAMLQALNDSLFKTLDHLFSTHEEADRIVLTCRLGRKPLENNCEM